jgi:ribosome-binding protein aMBF1 (putative translation factor)
MPIPAHGLGFRYTLLKSRCHSSAFIYSFPPAGDLPRQVKTFPQDHSTIGRVHDPLPDWVPRRRAEIGLRLRNARRAAGLSQMTLGDRIGRDHKTISRWENALRAPDLTDLLLIADALDVPLADLVR